MAKKNLDEILKALREILERAEEIKGSSIVRAVQDIPLISNEETVKTLQEIVNTASEISAMIASIREIAIEQRIKLDALVPKR